jgi:hypothetical protein
MKKFETLQFIGSLCLFIGTISFVSYCFGEVHNNARCINGVSPSTCSSAGNALCQTGGNAYQLVSCTYCSSSNQIADKYCVGWEGYQCNIVSSHANPCYDVPQKRGMCLQVNDHYECTNPQNLPGNCIAMLSEYICNP